MGPSLTNYCCEKFRSMKFRSTMQNPEVDLSLVGNSMLRGSFDFKIDMRNSRDISS
jgi:hypothetical protein